EINAAAPCVRGTEWPEDLVPSAVVEVNYPLAVAPTTIASDLDRAIGESVARCILDGATIQVGIGAVASAVVASLAARRHLRIHSGLFTEPLWALQKSGAVQAQTSQDAVVTCSAVYGSAGLYAEVHDNPAYRIAPPAVTHGLAALAALPRFTSINSALEIDLFGQVNAESAGGRYLGGIGGLNDFVRGALASPGGSAIIAAPSRRRSAKGEVGSIVSALSGPATVPAADADVFVTEHGVARMRGASRSERALAIIGLAHPDDRESLTRAARALGLI
ncbi:MAG: acetyl-CoA hydrolase, partial [Burkholderiales bacterium]|nr:acetyl-CoA hydrolase [Burkholderiales bacterium]